MPVADGFGFWGLYEDEEEFNIAEQQRVTGIGENVLIGPGDAEFGHMVEIATMRQTDANFTPFHRRQLRLEDIASVNETREKRDVREPKVVMTCHKHLVDRHLQGKPAICDDLGNMNSAPVNLMWGSKRRGQRRNGILERIHQAEEDLK